MPGKNIVHMGKQKLNIQAGQLNLPPDIAFNGQQERWHHQLSIAAQIQTETPFLSHARSKSISQL